MKFCLYCGTPMGDGPCPNCVARPTLTMHERQTTARDVIEKLADTMDRDNAADMVGRLLQSHVDAITQLTKALKTLIIDANRLCDRQLGGSYEQDCRLAITEARTTLGALPKEFR